jgi:hypothetical protein
MFMIKPGRITKNKSAAAILRKLGLIRISP